MLNIEIQLLDVWNEEPIGQGEIAVIIKKLATQVFVVTPPTRFQKGKAKIQAGVSDDWTEVRIDITSDSYARQGVVLQRQQGTNTFYANNLVDVDFQGQTLKVKLMLIRVRLAPGIVPSTMLAVGQDPKAALLEISSGKNVYRDISRRNLLTRRPVRWVDFTVEPNIIFDDLDSANWGRFQYESASSNPLADGASLLVEYGGVGNGVSINDPKFLVALWVPSIELTTKESWRDIIVFFHPSTANGKFPISPWPYKDHYPYEVAVDTTTTSSNNKFQPYVDLGLRHLVGQWTPFHNNLNRAVCIAPIYPAPPPNASKTEFWLPFCTPEGLYRFIQEVNCFLEHFKFANPTIGNWNGEISDRVNLKPSPADNIRFAPRQPIQITRLERVATAGFSASSMPLHRLLSDEKLSLSTNFPKKLWSGNAENFAKLWKQLWALDLIYGNTTVPSATFESSLLRWQSQHPSDRSFALFHSGTTGGASPQQLYTRWKPGKKIMVSDKTGNKNRKGQLWLGKEGYAVFASNPLLRADVPLPPQPSGLPIFPEFPDPTASDDDVHGFMYQIALGFQLLVSTKIGSYVMIGMR